jgi:hypothetical protein
VKPRNKNSSDETSSSFSSLYYFGDIQSKTFESFREEFLGQTNGETIKQLLSQAQATSKILSRKYVLILLSFETCIAVKEDHNKWIFIPDLTSIAYRQNLNIVASRTT